MRVSQEKSRAGTAARAPGWSRGRLSALVLLTYGVVLALLARPLLTGRIYTFDDLGDFHLPVRFFYRNALLSGRSFLWSPQFFDGMYIYAEGQAGMMHPLHLLLYRCFSLPHAFNLEMLLSYGVLFPGMYVLLRRLDLPSHAALFGAFVFTFSGFNFLHFMHLNAVAIVAHIPWLLAAADVILETRDRRRLAWAQAAFALLTASQLLLGYPQYVWMTLLAVISFVAWRFPRSQGWGRVGVLVFAQVLGVLAGAVQLLPTLDALKTSVRSDPSLAFRLSYSLSLPNLTQLWAPYALKDRFYPDYLHSGVGNTHEFGLYDGAFCTVSLFWLLIRWRSLGRWQSLTAAVLIFGATMLLFSLGGYGGIYRYMARLPVLDLFRAPCRYIVLVHLALSILAAVAFADLGELISERCILPWRSLCPLLIPLLLSAATAILLFWLRHAHPHAALVSYLSTTKWAAFSLSLILAATLLVALIARGFSPGLPLLIVFVAADMAYSGLHYVWAVPAASVSSYVASMAPPPVVTAGARLYIPDGVWSSNVVTMTGHSLTGGYFGLNPAKALDYSHVASQRVAGVQWRLAGGTWQRVPAPLPRVRLLTDTRVSLAPAQDVEHIDSARTALVERAVTLGSGVAGTLRVMENEPGVVRVATTTSTRQLLVLSESYDLGWRVAEDGRPIALERAYGDYLACAVDPGSHTILFHFQPQSFTRGLAVSLGACCLMLAWCGITLLSPKPGPK